MNFKKRIFLNLKKMENGFEKEFKLIILKRFFFPNHFEFKI